MSNTVRFFVSKPEKPDADDRHGLDNSTSEATALKGVNSYGSLPQTKLDGTPSSVANDSSGIRRGDLILMALC